VLTGQWPNTTDAQRSSETTWFSISHVLAGTSGLVEEDRLAFRQLAQFGQPAKKADGLTIGLSSTTTTKEPRLTAFRQNQTKN
jgi:hypothetical protein